MGNVAEGLSHTSQGIKDGLVDDDEILAFL
jgi:hypothetical protein